MRKGLIIALSSIGGAVVVVAAIMIGVLIGTSLGSVVGAANSPGGGSSGGTNGSVPTRADEDFGTVEVYAVRDDGTLDPEATGLAAEVWDAYSRMTDGQLAGDLVAEFVVGDAPQSDTLAYVITLDDPEQWSLAANLATSEDPELLIATLIHEFAHILTLRTDEMDPPIARCPTVDLDEGCAADDSVIAAFEERFWESYGIDAPEPWNTDPDIAWEFYVDHEEDFVSDYAATNVAEDLAESFMTYVIEDAATGDSIAAQKLRFFDEYPEYVELRDHIRSEVATDLGH